MLRIRNRMASVFCVTVPVFCALVLTTGCNRDPNVRKQKYLESGKRYEKDGKFREASIQFQNALKVDHDFGAAHYELGKTYLKLGAIRPGYSELLRAVQLDPKNLAARVDLGNLLLGGNALDRAEEQAKAVLAADPNNADAYALMAGIAARKGNRPDAVSNIQRALSIKPNEASFHTSLALLENADPQSGTAPEQELQKAISLDPKNVQPRMVLAALLEKKGDRAGAVQQCQAAIQQAPKELQPRAALAGVYLRAGDKDNSEKVLRQAVDDLPDSEDASTLLKDFYLRTGQAGQAETVFAELYSKHSKSYPIKLNYASILVGKGDYAKAAPLSAELNKSNASQPQVQLLKTALLLHDGKTDEAYTVLQNAVKNAPDNLQLQLSLARVAQSKGDAGAAETQYRAAEKLAPKDLEIQAALGQLAAQRGDWGALAQVAEKTIAMRSDIAQAYLWRGISEENEKQPEKAEADFQTALTKDPNSSAAYVELGQLKQRQGHIPEGTALLQKALDRDPNAVAALQGIVGADLYAKQPDKAVARIQQQIARSPKNPAFYAMLASVQLNGTKDLNGARDNAKKAMDMQPGNRGPMETYTQAVARLGNVDEALRTWNNWAAAHPKDDYAVFMQGILEDQKGDQGKAIEQYKKALQMPSQTTTTHVDYTQAMASNNLAFLMIQTGQSPDMALSYAQTARAGLPNSPDTADTLAWVYYKKGNYLSARDLLEDGSKQNPDNAAMHYHLGMTYAKLGKNSDAQTQLKKALAIDPNAQWSKDANAALSQLH